MFFCRWSTKPDSVPKNAVVNWWFPGFYCYYFSKAMKCFKLSVCSGELDRKDYPLSLIQWQPYRCTCLELNRLKKIYNCLD